MTEKYTEEQIKLFDDIIIDHLGNEKLTKHHVVLSLYPKAKELLRDPSYDLKEWE